MLTDKKRTAIVDTLSSDKEKKSYVYALCEKTDKGELIPFYIGKGEGERVWAHEEGANKEIDHIKATLSEEEWESAVSELSEKYKKIHTLGADRVEKVIIKWGLTEYEAFMAESALINLLKLDGLVFSAKTDGLTNIANGHSSKVEKEMIGNTEAMTVDRFYEECALEPLDFIKDVCPKIDAALICINAGYPECIRLDKEEQKAAVREAVRGFWKLRNNAPKYVIAMYQQKVVGVFRIKQTYI